MSIQMDGPSSSTKPGNSRRPKKSKKGKENAAFSADSTHEIAAASVDALTEEDKGEEWAWKTLADSTVSTRNPAFTKDGK